MLHTYKCNLNRSKKTNKTIKYLTLLTLIFISFPALAQIQLYGEDPTKPKITDLNWLNQTFLDKQRALADEISRKNFGMRIKKADNGQDTKGNFKIIQRLIDEKRIDSQDTNSWQAMGVILGDIYVNQVAELRWKTYEDELGKSHAVCYQGKETCIFPITMISRRVKVGSQPNIEQIYAKGLGYFEEHKKKLPYSFESPTKKSYSTKSTDSIEPVPLN